MGQSPIPQVFAFKKLCLPYKPSAHTTQHLSCGGRTRLIEQQNLSTPLATLKIGLSESTCSHRLCRKGQEPRLTWGKAPYPKFLHSKSCACHTNPLHTPHSTSPAEGSTRFIEQQNLSTPLASLTFGLSGSKCSCIFCPLSLLPSYVPPAARTFLPHCFIIIVLGYGGSAPMIKNSP